MLVSIFFLHWNEERRQEVSTEIGSEVLVEISSYVYAVYCICIISALNGVHVLNHFVPHFIYVFCFPLSKDAVTLYRALQY